MRPRAPPRALPEGVKTARLFLVFLVFLVLALFVFFVDLFVEVVLELLLDILVEVFVGALHLGSLQEGAVTAGG